MKLVVDANIVFAALIKESKTRELLFDPRLELIAPFTLWEELEKYRRTLQEKTHLSQGEFNELIAILQRHIKQIPKERLQVEAEKMAAIVPDIKDVYYLTTSMMMKIPLWSNDKQLKSFQKIQIISTAELIFYLDPKNTPYEG